MLARFIAIIFLVLLSPILVFIALVVLIDDGLPIIFNQKRIGKKNNIFWIYKFRTMKKDTADIPTHLMEKDLSIYTSSGPFLRKNSLDELPQLLNIIKGDIGFIGPRPALFNQDDLIQLRTEKKIHKLLPGVTGWAQVNGRDKLSISKKVEMDYFYLKNKSMILNIKILGLTILKLFKSDDVLV